MKLGLGLGLANSGGANVAAPTVISATIDQSGTTFTVVFSESVTLTSATGITITDVTRSTTPVATYVSGSGSNTAVFSLGTTVHNNDSVTWAYVSGSGNIVAAGLGHAPLASFSGAAIVNNSVQ